MLIQEMPESDCLNALKRTRLGRLACARDNQPYVVPIYFAYEKPYLYGITTLGQKVEWMRSNPLVCVELDEMLNGGQWMSILIFGKYEEIQEQERTSEWSQEQRRALNTWEPTTGATEVSSCPGKQARLHALQMLQEHGEWWEAFCASSSHRDPDQPLTPVFYRIHIGRITGRRATPNQARDTQGWLPKLCHALTRPFVGR